VACSPSGAPRSSSYANNTTIYRKPKVKAGYSKCTRSRDKLKASSNGAQTEGNAKQRTLALSTSGREGSLARVWEESSGKDFGHYARLTSSLRAICSWGRKRNPRARRWRALGAEPPVPVQMEALRSFQGSPLCFPPCRRARGFYPESIFKPRYRQRPRDTSASRARVGRSNVITVKGSGRGRGRGGRGRGPGPPGPFRRVTLGGRRCN